MSEEKTFQMLIKEKILVLILQIIINNDIKKLLSENE